MILSAPATVATLSREAICDLLAQNAAVQSTLTARLSCAPAGDTNGAGAAHVEDEMLTVAEAAKLLRREPRWIWRHKNLPFVRRISARSLLCSKRGVETWLASRKVRP